MNRFRLLLLLLVSTFYCRAQPADTARITNFIVKENLLKNGQLAIIAANKNDVPSETVSGTASFTVNGFSRELVFHEGVAVLKEKIEKSMFVYLKYEGEESVSKLYFVRAKDNDLSPIYISWIALLLIPVLLILLPLLFRKLIVYAVIILVIIFYFNSKHGLDFSMFFRTVFDGLGSLF